MRKQLPSLYARIRYHGGPLEGHHYHIVISTKFNKSWGHWVPEKIICQGVCHDPPDEIARNFFDGIRKFLFGLSFREKECPEHHIKKMVYDHFKSEYPQLKMQNVYVYSGDGDTQFYSVMISVQIPDK